MKNIDIATDNGDRAFAYSKMDIAIPLRQCAELSKILDKINETAKKLALLVDDVNYIYAHCYITISSDSDQQNA